MTPKSNFCKMKNRIKKEYCKGNLRMPYASRQKVIMSPCGQRTNPPTVVQHSRGILPDFYGGRAPAGLSVILMITFSCSILPCITGIRSLLHSASAGSWIWQCQMPHCSFRCWWQYPPRRGSAPHRGSAWVWQ